MMGFVQTLHGQNLTNEYIDNAYELPVQVNGKLKGVISTKIDEKEDYLVKKGKRLNWCRKALKQKTVIKTIYIPKKILNIVVK